MPIKIDHDSAIELLTNIIDKLENIHIDQDGNKFFYGGSKIPLYSDDGSELETQHNQDVIRDNLDSLKKCFVGNSNWSNMNKSQKFVGNHLRWCFKVLTNQPLKWKTIRFPKYNSYMVRKHYIPSLTSSTPISSEVVEPIS